MDTYFDIYGDPWGVSGRKNGAAAPEAGNPEEKKLFIWIALTGNIIGMLLTFQSGGDKVYSSGYRMEKEETGAYEEKFKVSVDGEEAGSLYVQVPEKETEGSEEEPETELSEEQQREKELQDMIVQYNQKKNDSQYYYLPDEWNGKHLEWEQTKDKTGNLLSALGLAAAAAAVIAKKRERTECSNKKKRTDADGLSGTDHEIYPSGAGRLNCQKSIPENSAGLRKERRW